MAKHRTPEREVVASILTQVTVLSPWARYIYVLKVLIIPRKRWPRPDMAEKLFAGTLSKNETKSEYIL